MRHLLRLKCGENILFAPRTGEKAHPTAFPAPTSMKSILTSKTVWVNVITTLLEIILVLQDVMPVKYLGYTTIAKSVLNIILRVWFTSSPIYAQPEVKPGTTYRVE